MRSEQIVSEVELHHLAQNIYGFKFHQLLNIVSYGGHDDALVGEFNAPCVDRLMAKKLIKVPNTGSTVMLLEGFECIAAAVSGEPNPRKTIWANISSYIINLTHESYYA